MDLGLFSAAHAVYRFAEVVSRLTDVPDEARRFCRLIQRVRTDFEEAIRLNSTPAVQLRFDVEPEQKEYVQGAIRDIKAALDDIGRFVESIRVQDDNGAGSVSLNKRAMWLWQHQSKVVMSNLELSTCHQSLLGAMQAMRTWSAGTVVASPLSPPPPYIAVTNKDTIGDESIDIQRKRTRAERRQKAAEYGSAQLSPGGISPSLRRARSSSNFSFNGEGTEDLYAGPPPTYTTQDDIGTTRSYFHYDQKVPWSASTNTQAPAELASMPVRPQVAELESFLPAPYQTASLTSTSTSLSSTLFSPIELIGRPNSSYFPSMPSTPFVPYINPATPSFQDERIPKQLHDRAFGEAGNTEYFGTKPLLECSTLDRIGIQHNVQLLPPVIPPKVEVSGHSIHEGARPPRSVAEEQREMRRARRRLLSHG